MRRVSFISLSLIAVLCASAALAACGDSSTSTTTLPKGKLGDSLEAPPEDPVVGDYRGPASDGRTVTFTYKDGKVSDFRMGYGVHFQPTDVTAPTAKKPYWGFTVRGGNSLEWVGKWSSYGTWVDGTYQYKDSGGYLKTITWKANALSG